MLASVSVRFNIDESELILGDNIEAHWMQPQLEGRLCKLNTPDVKQRSKVDTFNVEEGSKLSFLFAIFVYWYGNNTNMYRTYC